MRQQTSGGGPGRYAYAALIVGLLGLVAARPWGQLNERLGIVTAMDTFRADSVNHAGRDSLMIEEVAVTLPDIISDSLNHSITTRQKKRAYLEEQCAWYQKENQRLDVKLKALNLAYLKKKRALTMPMSDIDALLSKQNPNGKRDAKHLEVSDLESELNQRTGKKSDP